MIHQDKVEYALLKILDPIIFLTAPEIKGIFFLKHPPSENSESHKFPLTF